MGDVHSRIVTFDRWLRASVGGGVVRLPFGGAVVTGDLPRVYDQNAVWVERPTGADEILDGVEDLANRSGWEHRTVEVADREVADGLRSTFIGAGYEEERYVTMVLVEAAAWDDHGAVGVVDIAEQVELSRALLAEESWANSGEVFEQFAERERRMAGVANGRVVVAPSDGPVSRCLVLTDGVTTAIDEVGTLADHRGRGWGRVVVQRALRTALDDGAERVVVTADESDWPRGWYGRLGFRQVGRVSLFRRWPS